MTPRDGTDETAPGDGVTVDQVEHDFSMPDDADLRPVDEDGRVGGEDDDDRGAA